MSDTSTHVRAHIATVVVACLGILVAYLPVVGVPVVLGEIAKDTGAQTSQLQWITSAGLLTLAVSVLSAGALADVLGRKMILIWGLVLMLIGSLVATLSVTAEGTSTLPWLYTGQAIIGVGGGALLTSTLALISMAATTTHQRTVFISVWASCIVIGSGAGPLISGAVTAVADWNWVFLPLSITAALLIPAAITCVPKTPSVHGRGLDLPGQLTAGLAVTALVYGIIEGPRAGWSSGQTIATFAVAGIFTLIFIFVELSTRTPLVALNLFRSPGFVVAAAAALVILFAIVGTAFVLTLYLTNAQQLTVTQIAVRIGMLYLLAAISGPVAGQLQRKVSSSLLLVTGLLIAAVGTVTLLGTTPESTWADFAWRLGLAGIGVGAVLSTVSAVAIHSAPLTQAGMAGATNTLFRQIGAALGPSVVGTVLATQLSDGNDLTSAFHTCAAVMAIALAASALLAGLVLLTPRRGRRH